jgi:integrase
MSKRVHNEGTVFERRGRLRADGTRESNRWVAEITIDTPDGPKRKVMYATSQREALQRLEAAKLARHQHRIGSITGQTLGEFMDGWLATVRTSIRPSTYESYKNNVRRIKRYLAHRELASVKPADIQDWYLRLQAEGLSPYTIAQARRVLHIALGDAVRWELIPRNPIDVTKPPRVEHVEKSWLRANEARTLFKKTGGQPLHALWVVLATTGLRIGEALALDWSDFDSEARTIRVRRAIQRQKGAGLVFVDTKTEKSRRTVELTQLATNALLRHREEQEKAREQLGSAWKNSNLIFCTSVGGPLDGTNVYRSLRRVLVKNEIRRVGLHALRHSAASLMLAEGVPMKVVQEILGHSSYQLTANTYSHIAPDLRRDAAKRLDALFGEEDRELE